VRPITHKAENSFVCGKLFLGLNLIQFILLNEQDFLI
jgi:hypothetical protein